MKTTQINYGDLNMLLDLFGGVINPNYLVTGGLTFLVLGCGFLSARFHPASFMNVDFNDPKTLYAYLNQNCGTISVPLEGGTGRKLIQQFPGSDIQHFISKYENILPNKGEGLEEAQEFFRNTSELWMNGLSLPVVPKQTVIEYFIQDAQITGILQASNGYSNLGIYNLFIDIGLLGATLVGTPILCYYCSDIVLGFGNAVIANDATFIEILQWYGSAFCCISTLKSMKEIACYSFTTPIKVSDFLCHGIAQCKPLLPKVAALYKSGITGTLEYPQIIENNIVFVHHSKSYGPFVHKFLTKTEFLTPLKYGIESLFMLSNLGWDFSTASILADQTNAFQPENVNFISKVSQLKLLKC